MNPTCLAPLTGRFPRILPQTKLDRFLNFVKFDIVEPLWPASPGEPQTAQKSHKTAKAF
jgi:hypothetical protein